MTEEKLSLTNIEGGAAVEMFDLALQRILENIHDINTTVDAREITLKVKITPVGDDRSIIAYGILCNTKQSGQPPIKGMADLKVEQGRLVAIGRRQKQTGIPFSNVKSIKKEE